MIKNICLDFQKEEVHSVVGDVVKQFMFATTGNASDSPETKSQFLRSITTSQNNHQVLETKFDETYLTSFDNTNIGTIEL
jgi:hypothetical protein